MGEETTLSGGTQSRALQSRFVRSLLDIIILNLLEDKPMHGYMINGELRKTFGRSFSPSTLYPLLYTLEEEGYIEGTWGTRTKRQRRVYNITPKGEEHLSSSLFILEGITKKLKLSFEKSKER